MKIELLSSQSMTMSVRDKYITGENSTNDRGYQGGFGRGVYIRQELEK